MGLVGSLSVTSTLSIANTSTLCVIRTVSCGRQTQGAGQDSHATEPIAPQLVITRYPAGAVLPVIGEELWLRSERNSICAYAPKYAYCSQYHERACNCLQ